jgi:hypothetical protein
MRSRFPTLRLALLLSPLLVGVGCSNHQATAPTAPSEAAGRPPGPYYFADRTAETGIRFVYRNGQEANHYAILESLGGGVGLLDYDRDGRLDVFVTGGGYFGPQQAILGYPNRLFRNEGNWRFRDVTAEVGLPVDDPPCYSHGVAVGDYNNDGWPDLLVTGYGRLALYRNNAGTFEDVTAAAGLRDQRELHWSTSAAWGDLNADGHPDLFVGHYVDWSFKNHPRCGGYRPDQAVDVCPPKQFRPLLPALYLSNGDGTFRDASQEAGLKPGKVLGVLILDVNADGQPDIYVANDTIDNHLYLNLGGGRFAEVAAASGVDVDDGGMPNGSMGVDGADYDHTGRFSLFVTNYQNEAHALYRNQENGTHPALPAQVPLPLFQHSSRSAGITAIGLIYVGFGTGFLDIDNDGNEDILITNGHVVRYPQPPGTLRQRPILFRNAYKPGTLQTAFDDVTDLGGPYFWEQHMGRGAAFGDLDNDGKTDVVLNPTNEPVTVLQNVTATGNHWLGVSLVGQQDRDAVGAVLTLAVGGRTLTRAVKGGGSYLSARDLRVVFGLGAHQQAGTLTVRWPSGKVQTWASLPIDRYWRLVEGEKDPQPADPPGAR